MEQETPDYSYLNTDYIDHLSNSDDPVFRSGFKDIIQQLNGRVLTPFAGDSMHITKI